MLEKKMKGSVFFAVVFFVLVFVSIDFAQAAVAVNFDRASVNSLLGIPRRKLVMSETDPNLLWINVQASEARDDLIYSTDGGATWTPVDFGASHGTNDNHDSFDIDSYGNIHVGKRGGSGAYSYDRYDAPVQSSGAFNLANRETFTHSGYSGWTDSAVVVYGDEVFLITRDDTGQDIAWDRSLDNGITWSQSGTVMTSTSGEIRVGSMLIDGVPYAIIREIQAPFDTVSFYRWDGSGFTRDNSLDLTLESSDGATRIFSVTQATDGRVHVAYFDVSPYRVRHVYKRTSDAEWSTPVTLFTCAGLECGVSITAHGNDVYVASPFWNGAINELDYRVFDGDTLTWGAPIVLDNSGDVTQPAFPKWVDASRDYIPIAWVRDGLTMYYESIPVTPQTGGDTTPPVLSGGSPGGALSSGTTSTTLQVTTNEAATCKYSTTSGQSYAAMSSTFSTTGTTSHSQSISGLSDGNNYNYYVRCNDTSGNFNTADYMISFSVSNPIVVGAEDVNSDGSTDIIDLVLISFWQGKQNTDGDWSLFSHLDVNSDGRISWGDVLSVTGIIGI